MKNLPNRKRTRLSNYDYNLPGYYFITTCIKNKYIKLGSIIEGNLKLNNFGLIVRDCWNDLPNHYLNIQLDYFVVMPDHFHGIIILLNEKGSISSGGKHGLSEIIRGFKTFSSKRINEQLRGDKKFGWQKSFYDRIIRNERELYNIRKYIEQNPLKMELDNSLPENLEL